ncbi:myoneurin-like [Musca domestica]|uniref:Myoneurin-like n=1 Tax=Musca domestica TaxID=7370 RepID=A0A1I8NHS9_MUSDO|nr:myoneurin-like [Musca domestica]
MNDYVEYMRIGEILRSPKAKNDTYQYILKCHHDKYFELEEESIMLPCIAQCDALGNEEEEGCDEKTEINYQINIQRENCENIEDAIEDRRSDKDMDPLNLIANRKSSDSETENDEEQFLKQGQSTELTVEDVNKSEVEENQEEPLTDSDEIDMESIKFDKESTADSKDNSPLSSGTFVQNFIKSRQNLKLFIESYKEQPELWNSKLPPKLSVKLKEKYWEKIKNVLQNKYKIDMTTVQIERVIKHLNLQYKRSQNRSSKDQKPLWFIKELEFLRPAYESAKPSVKLKPQHCELKNKQITQLLDIYERYPNLWNSNLIENCCKNKRNESFEQMLQAVNSEMNLNIDEEKLRGYLHFIHNEYAKEKRLDIRNCDSKADNKHPYYKRAQFLYDHVGPFKCSECNAELKNPLNFKLHKSQHDGTMPLKCSLCSKGFKVLGTYVLHARRHMDDLEEVCQECGKKFINSYDLKVHMRFHTGSKPFCCEICGASFRHIQTFAGHKRRHEKKYLHHCPTCSKGFYCKAKLDDHIRSHKQIREFNCETCGKAFITKKTLQQHLVTHEDIRKYVCTLCGKSFKLKVGLNQHMRTHGSLSYERPEEV